MIAHTWALVSVSPGYDGHAGFATFRCLACQSTTIIEEGPRPRTIPFMGCEERALRPGGR